MNRPKTASAEIVGLVRRNEPEGVERLYRVFSHGVRYYLCTRLEPEDLEDRLHDCFLVVLQALKRGELRQPERLMGFIRTVVRRQLAAHIDHAINRRQRHTPVEELPHLADGRHDPENAAITSERHELARKVLHCIEGKDREVLVRFYLYEQPAQQICRQMRLTDTQFRLLKSRAKARFGEAGKRQLQLPFTNWRDVA